MIRKHIARALRAESRSAQLQVHRPAGQPEAEGAPADVIVECGWGRLLPAQTWRDAAALAEALLAERPGQRDIAFYVEKPHVVVARAPQQLFLDPSEAFRLNLATYRGQSQRAGRAGRGERRGHQGLARDRSADRLQRRAGRTLHPPPPRRARL